MQRLASAVSIPWPSFVVAFLFYVGLTLVVLGVADLPVIFVAAYGLPVAIYGGVLLWRAVRTLGTVRIDMGELPYPSWR